MISTATNDEAVELGNDELISGDKQQDEAIVDLADAKSEDDFAVLAEAELQSEIESEEV